MECENKKDSDLSAHPLLTHFLLLHIYNLWILEYLARVVRRLQSGTYRSWTVTVGS